MRRVFVLTLFVVGFVLGIRTEAYLDATDRILDEAYYLSKINILMWDAREGLDEEGLKEVNQLLLVHLNRYRIASQSVPDFLKTGEMRKEICLSFVTSDQAPWNVYKSMLVRDGLYEYVKDSISHCPYHYDI